MQKTASLFCATLLWINAANAQISFGPAAGFHLTSYNQTFDGRSVPEKGEVPILNIRAGVVADMPLSPRFHFQPSILYTTNGYYWQDPTRPYIKRFRINAIDVPLLISFHSGMKNQSHFFFSAGPFLALHTGGYIAVTEPFSTEQRRKIKTGADTPADVRRLGAGGLLNIGYQLKKGIFVSAHYQYALKNIIPTPDSDRIYMTGHNYGLTLGYLFYPKNKKERKEKASKPKPSY